MAKIKLAEPYETFVGRDSAAFTPNGSVVFNRSGIPSSRSFVRPRQPNNANQYFARYAFFLATQAWTAHSDSDKDSWDALGLTITRTNAAGFTYHPSGRSLYIENFLIASRNDASQIDTAPATVSYPVILPANEIQIGPTPDQMIVFLPPVTFATSLLLYVTGPLSTGVRSLRGRNFTNPTFTPVDPAFIQGALFTLAPADDTLHFLDDSLRIIPAIGQRWGIRLTILDPLANVTGPSYDAILTPHGP